MRWIDLSSTALGAADEDEIRTFALLLATGAPSSGYAGTDAEVFDGAWHGKGTYVLQG